MRASLLLIENDENVSAALITGIQTNYKISINVTTSLKDALEILKNNVFHAIICDLILSDSRGDEIIKAVQNVVPNTPIIAITGSEEDCDFSKTILGSEDYLIRGQFNFDHLVRAVRRAIERHKTNQIFHPIQKELDKSTEMVEDLRKITKDIKNGGSS